MKLRHPGMIRLAGLVGAGAVRLWLSTVRLRQRTVEPEVVPDSSACRRRFIYAFWHEGMLYLAARYPAANIRVLISQHADGELIAQVVQHLGFRTVRGSTTRGGAKAVREMMHLAKNSHLAVTPDGPRGPRRQVQMGTIFLASQTGLPVVPVGIGYSHAWRAKSWDRFAVPMPGALATCVTAPMLAVPPRLDKPGYENFRQELQRRLDTATAAAEAWATRG